MPGNSRGPYSSVQVIGMATNFYQTADYLSTLANVCESAQRLELPGMDSAAHASGSFATANTVDNSDKLYYLYNTEQQTLSTSSTINHHHLDSSPLYSVTSQQQTLPLPTCLHLPQSNSLVDLLTPFPTPPPTPDNSHSRIHSSLLSPQTHLGIHLNPLTNNNVSYSKFQQYLDETWPEDPHRRGSAVIRASVYKKIADVLHGLFTGSARFKHWVKKSEFFLVEKFQPGVGYGACLAIPETKSRTVSTNAKTRLNCKAPIQVGQHSYKLVARLEDFIHIIGNYHNCQKGHHGIRKTYKMVSIELQDKSELLLLLQ